MNLKTTIMRIAGTALLACGCVNVSAQEKSPPNIVFMLADDLGINDVAAFASHFTGKKSEELFYETPQLNPNYDATQDKRPYPFCDLRDSGLMAK